jgi:hypothetical protein
MGLQIAIVIAMKNAGCSKTVPARGYYNTHVFQPGVVARKCLNGFKGSFERDVHASISEVGRDNMGREMQRGWITD